VHINNLEHANAVCEKQIAALQKEIAELGSEIRAILTSTCWRFTQPLRSAALIIKRGLNLVTNSICRRNQFNAKWYLKRNPDVAMNGMDPYEHYVLFGKAEGRRPRPDPFIIRNINRGRILFLALHAASRSEGGLLSRAKNSLHVLKMEGIEGAKKRILSLSNQSADSNDIQQAYRNYIKSVEPADGELEVMRERQASFSYKPKFSITVPVYNVKEEWLRRFIESVRSQVYPNWELCIADDCSTLKHIRPLLERYAALDGRIKVVFRKVNGHISAATNSAIELATGEFMCLMDNDDEIAPNALYEFASLLQQDGRIDMIYSDEDKLDMQGKRYEPFFKPDWSPETLEGCMYTAHFACYRMSIVRELGGFRVGYDGAQDYDFVLRFTERAKKIAHVPKILYHWRAIPGSTAATMDAKDYVMDAAVRSLRDRAERVNGGGKVKLGRYAGSFDVRYTIQGAPLVSIVIPSAGREAVVRGSSVDLLSNVVKSIHEKNTYHNFEIIIVDNGDLRPETIKALSPYNCSYVHFEGSFNIATKMNMGAKKSKGDYLLFMNDDIEVRADDWMECMLQLAQRPGIGAVGAKLHFENGKIQHVGVAFWNGLPDHIRREFPEMDPGHFFSTCSNRNYLAVTGAVLLTKRSTFEKVNGFDERFAVNYNDVDYCLKVFENDERIVFASGAELYHFESISRERIVAEEEINLFRSKWRELVSSDPYYSANFESHPPNFMLRRDWAIETS
jgi:GT2 family glycosyltransferase